jgi:hypothetical protein
VTLAELAEHGIVGSADALPMPVGPQMPDFPPQPETELEKLRSERARLQGLLAEAVADAPRARRERDLMRERVSEPFGCAHCGITKRGHGRRWTTGVGYHAWTAPSEGQIAERMKARRTVRLAARAGELGRLRAQVEALLAERHSTNEALDDAVQALREDKPTKDTLPAWLYRRFMPDGTGWDYLDSGQREYWEHQARAVRRAVERGGFKAARDPRGCSACGDLPEAWCPDCAACKAGCFGGFNGNECTHANAPWGGA